MGKIFTLTNDIKQIASDAIDDLIDQLGKQCRLVYSGIKTDCPNCIFDPQSKKSTGIYKAGGPRPFPNRTICPVCRGAGQIDTTSTEVVTLLCNWNPRDFYIFPINIEQPHSMVQTKGYIKDLPKILRARKMVLEIPIEPYTRYTFDLISEPIDPGNIIQGRYFVAIWKRSG